MYINMYMTLVWSPKGAVHFRNFHQLRWRHLVLWSVLACHYPLVWVTYLLYSDSLVTLVGSDTVAMLANYCVHCRIRLMCCEPNRLLIPFARCPIGLSMSSIKIRWAFFSQSLQSLWPTTLIDFISAVCSVTFKMIVCKAFLGPHSSSFSWCFRYI